MSQQFDIALLLFLLLFGCGQTKSSNDNTKLKMKLTYEVISEDYDRNLYYVEWNDTLGQSEGYLPDNFHKRPKVICCFITNKNGDTLSHNQGLSTAQPFVYFQTTDTIVTLNFITCLNVFSDKFETDSNAARAYWEANKIPIEFEPIKIKTTDLRKKFEIVLKEKKLPPTSRQIKAGLNSVN